MNVGRMFGIINIDINNVFDIAFASSTWAMAVDDWAYVLRCSPRPRVVCVRTEQMLWRIADLLLAWERTFFHSADTAEWINHVLWSR